MSWFHRRSNKIGDYTVDEKIGQGGTGDVYKAIHPKTGAAVAIKILSKELADEPILLKRFEQEFQITRALQHRHIVQALDFGVSGGLPFLVMEYVEGTTLWRHIRSEGRLAINDAVQLLHPIGEALQLAHDNGLIHRDVKPDNILLDENGSPKLTDFGLVKDLETDLNLTDSATALGTPNFMAPEQFQDSKRADHRCDVYGLAATMYMAVTGIVPFAAQGGLSILKKKLHGDLIPIRQIVPDLPAAIEWNLMRAMRSRRDDRPNSCREFFAGLMSESVPQESEEAVENVQERRAAPRFPCNLGSNCIPFNQRDARPWPARIVDVSTKGMALVLGRRFEPKHVLRVVLPFSEPLGEQPVYVRVCNVAPFAHGGWRIGCQFTSDLGNDDLQLLLKELPEFGVKDPEVCDMGERDGI